ncbi:putative permease [Rhizobium leguminosarum]|nr:putative permease [Rhizobium leguminosarum]
MRKADPDPPIPRALEDFSADIVSLLLPFFGLILIGYAAAKATKQPAEALGWLNTFIIYAALPALFFKLVSRTPIEELTRVDFIVTDIAATYAVFILLFAIGRVLRGNSLADCTIQSFTGAYGNIGYIGSRLALLALGDGAAVPVALIICFRKRCAVYTTKVSWDEMPTIEMV